jgi:hypothetical protein
LRRGDYGDESVFYDTKYFRWQGAVAMLIGVVVSVWLFASTAVYVGYFAFNYPQIGDITFIVGFLISGGLYYVFNMGLRKEMTQTRAAVGSRA